MLVSPNASSLSSLPTTAVHTSVNTHPLRFREGLATAKTRQYAYPENFEIDFDDRRTPQTYVPAEPGVSADEMSQNTVRYVYVMGQPSSVGTVIRQDSEHPCPVAG